MLLEISGEITPEKIKGWVQSKNNTQLWMGLVIEARSDAVKSARAYCDVKKYIIVYHQTLFSLKN